ncbi:TPA: hypothetical protein ACOTG0_003086 [Clostridium perfringens]
MSLKELEKKLKNLSIEKNDNSSISLNEVDLINSSVDSNNPFNLDLSLLGGSRPRIEL